MATFIRTSRSEFPDCVPTRAGFPVAVRKWSVRIDEDLASRVEDHVAGRGLSGFVARAVEHELERDALAAHLDDLDAEFGPVPAELVDEYDAVWP